MEQVFARIVTTKEAKQPQFSRNISIPVTLPTDQNYQRPKISKNRKKLVKNALHLESKVPLRQHSKDIIILGGDLPKNTMQRREQPPSA